MADEVNVLIEKILQEKDLIQKAKLLLALKRDQRVPMVKISSKLKINPSYVSHLLRLNKLPELVIDGYYSKTIFPTHLFIIARLKDQQSMIDLYEKVLANNLTALETERYVRESLYELNDTGEYIKKSEARAFVKEMKGKGIESKVIQTRIKGKIILEIPGSLDKTTKILQEIMHVNRQLGK